MGVFERYFSSNDGDTFKYALIILALIYGLKTMRLL